MSRCRGPTAEATAAGGWSCWLSPPRAGHRRAHHNACSPNSHGGSTRARGGFAESLRGESGHDHDDPTACAERDHRTLAPREAPRGGASAAVRAGVLEPSRLKPQNFVPEGCRAGSPAHFPFSRASSSGAAYGYGSTMRVAAVRQRAHADAAQHLARPRRLEGRALHRSYVAFTDLPPGPAAGLSPTPVNADFYEAAARVNSCLGGAAPLGLYVLRQSSFDSIPARSLRGCAILLSAWSCVARSGP